MTGFEPQTSVNEVTALPTEPQPLPITRYNFYQCYYNGLCNSSATIMRLGHAHVHF